MSRKKYSRIKNISSSQASARRVVLGSDSNDDKEQLSLFQGSESYEAYAAVKKRNDMIKSDKSVATNLTIEDICRNDKELKCMQKDKDDIEYAYMKAHEDYINSYACQSANREARKARQNLKRAQVPKAKRVIEGALDHKIPVKDFSDEISDYGVSPDKFIKESADDYKREINKKKSQEESDDNDVYMTPGMRRLMRYMR